MRTARLALLLPLGGCIFLTGRPDDLSDHWPACEAFNWEGNCATPCENPGTPYYSYRSECDTGERCELDTATDEAWCR